MSDLSVIDPVEALDRAADPGEFVVMALERGKSWLAEALAHGDLDALVNAKGYAETLRVATMQKQLGHDAVLSATELVRRAERCIGLGVRRGQQAGEITKAGQSGGPGRPYEQQRNGRTIRVNPDPHQDVTRIRPDEYLTNSAERRDAYAMTDDVSDEQFEEAITEARNEGNLSRANLLRKVKPKPAPAPPERSEWNKGRRRIDPDRIIDQTVIALGGLELGLNLLTADDYDALDATKRLAWLEALHEPLAAINRMKKGLSG